MLPSRLERSTVQKERIMSLAAGEMTGSGGKWTGLDTILERGKQYFQEIMGVATHCLYISIGLEFQNGGYPVRNSYIRIPNAHQSTAVV